MTNKITFCVFFALVLFVAFYLYVTEKYLIFLVRSNPVVVLTQDGFVPSRIVVKSGTEVTFRSVAGRYYWPASNIHPNHSFYSDFDSRERIAPSDEWKFVFKKPGFWDYHDHLKPIFGGTIVVLDEDGSLPKSSYDCDNSENMEYEERQLCWYSEIKKELKSGVKNAFERFRFLYDNEALFRSGCHDVMHLIGDTVYLDFEKGKKIEFDETTTYCGYGFYHGFIEALAFRGGDLSEASDFCQSLSLSFSGNVKEPLAMYSCFHGIGHATFDSHDFSLWGSEEKMVRPAIEICRKVAKGLESETLKQCVTGVYNALGNAYSNKQYLLEMKEVDPYWFCDLEPEEFRDHCYTEVVVSWISINYGNENYSFAEGVKEVMRVKHLGGRKMTMFSVASDFTRHHIKEVGFEEMAKLCSKVEPEILDSCVEGVALGIFNWGDPGKEFEEVLSFCDLKPILGEVGFKACYEFTMPRVGTIYSVEKTKEFCGNLKYPEYKDICR